MADDSIELTAVQERVLREIFEINEENGQPTVTDLADRLRMKPDAVRDAIYVLVDAGLIGGPFGDEEPPACTCATCQSYCARKPGWFRPDEIAPLAANLGLTVQQLFDQHLAVDLWTAKPDTDEVDIFVLAPRTTYQKGGDTYGLNPLGRCHWLIEGRCAIHEAGKPFECRMAHHDNGPIGRRIHAEARDAWRDHQQMIAGLLGRPPARKEQTLFEQLFDGLFMAMDEPTPRDEDETP